jgi:hypothetical protein
MTTSKIVLVTLALLLSTVTSYAQIRAIDHCAGQLFSESDGNLSIRSWEGRCIIDQTEAGKVLSICEVGSDATVAPGADRGSSPLHPGQALALWLFPPVRPRVGTDDAAPGAHHARAERWH